MSVYNNTAIILIDPIETSKTTTPKTKTFEPSKPVLHKVCGTSMYIVVGETNMVVLARKALFLQSIQRTAFDPSKPILHKANGCSAYIVVGETNMFALAQKGRMLRSIRPAVSRRRALKVHRLRVKWYINIKKFQLLDDLKLELEIRNAQILLDEAIAFAAESKRKRLEIRAQRIELGRTIFAAYLSKREKLEIRAKHIELGRAIFVAHQAKRRAQVTANLQLELEIRAKNIERGQAIFESYLSKGDYYFDLPASLLVGGSSEDEEDTQSLCYSIDSIASLDDNDDDSLCFSVDDDDFDAPSIAIQSESTKATVVSVESESAWVAAVAPSKPVKSNSKKSPYKSMKPIKLTFAKSNRVTFATDLLTVRAYHNSALEKRLKLRAMEEIGAWLPENQRETDCMESWTLTLEGQKELQAEVDFFMMDNARQEMQKARRICKEISAAAAMAGLERQDRLKRMTRSKLGKIVDLLIGFLPQKRDSG